jgi:hypothetical protein
MRDVRRSGCAPRIYAPCSDTNAKQTPRFDAGALDVATNVRYSANIPGSRKSSSCGVVVAPGGVFVVEGVGLQAAVKDADPTVSELL